MTYVSRIRVRFADEDHAGIVYYPRFFDYFHTAFEDFLNDAGFPYRSVFAVDGLGFPTVHAEADYTQPIRFGDELDLTVEVEHLGRTSARFLYRGTRADDAAAIVTGRITVVCVTMSDLRPTPIPDKYRALFQAHRATSAAAPRP